MKTIFVSFIDLIALCLVNGIALANDVGVDSYYRSKETDVAPSYNSDNNSNVTAEQLSQGNYHPYIGKTGTNYYRNNPTSPSYNPYDRYPKKSNRSR